MAEAMDSEHCRNACEQGRLITHSDAAERTLWLGAHAKRVRQLSKAEVEDLKHFHLNYLVYKQEYFRVEGKWAR